MRPRGRFRVPARAAGKRRTYDRLMLMHARVEVPEGWGWGPGADTAQTGALGRYRQAVLQEATD
jgi:hypothetical protein